MIVLGMPGGACDGAAPAGGDAARCRMDVDARALGLHSQLPPGAGSGCVVSGRVIDLPDHRAAHTRFLLQVSESRELPSAARQAPAGHLERRLARRASAPLAEGGAGRSWPVRSGSWRCVCRPLARGSIPGF
jgi:competence protein ComEC